MKHIPILFFCILLTVFSSDAEAGAWCRPERAPVISVKTSSDDIRFDNSKSFLQLRQFDVDTINPYGKKADTKIGGLMQGGIQLEQSMRLSTITHQGLRQICAFYDEVNVRLHISPTIYIAKENQRGTCRYNAIKEHEMKHIQVDRDIVNKYADLIGSALRREVNRQSVYGPVSLGRAQEIQVGMRQRLEAVLRAYSDKMDGERRKRQQAIDSLEEYERVRRQCL
jgi:hypothetical protein